MSYEHVKNWRKRSISRLKKAFDSKCGICFYDKCEKALEFHHLSPNDKDFTISSWRKISKWSILVEEAKKCVLLCANCHREVHSNITSIPPNIIRFNQKFQEYRELSMFIVEKVKKPKIKKHCKTCNKEIPSDNKKYCSSKCYHKTKGKIAWDSIDLSSLLKEFNYSEVSRMLNISPQAVVKRAKKLGLK